MTKYIKMEWPEIQNYMGEPDYPDGVYYDPQRDSWFVPEGMYNRH